MNKTIELDGKKYELVPLKNKKKETDIAFYYGCDSSCGHFKFSILLNDDGSLWKKTQSITYYPKGYGNKESEYWDNYEFLKNILDDPNDKDVVELKDGIKNTKFENLINLLQQVRKKGWI